MIPIDMELHHAPARHPVARHAVHHLIHLILIRVRPVARVNCKQAVLYAFRAGNGGDDAVRRAQMRTEQPRPYAESLFAQVVQLTDILLHTRVGDFGHVDEVVAVAAKLVARINDALDALRVAAHEIARDVECPLHAVFVQRVQHVSQLLF